MDSIENERDDADLDQDDVAHPLAREMERLVSEIEAERQARSRLEDELSAVRISAGTEFGDLKKRMEQYRAKARTSDSFRKRHNALALYTNELEKHYYELLGSTSWRMTRPLRAVATAIRGMITGRRPEVEWNPMDFKQARTGAGNARKVESQVKAMRRRMLDLGFLDAAQRRFAEWVMDESQPYRRRLAARELVTWYLNEGTRDAAHKALEYLPIMIEGETGSEASRRVRILEAEALHRLDDEVRARDVLMRVLQDGEHPDVHLALANLESSPERRIERINDALAMFGLEPIRLLLDEGVKAYDRMQVELPEAKELPQHECPLISVIMPAYNSEATISTAIRSLQAQTWENFELVVVDDCSADNTAAIVEACCGEDPRIRLLLAASNGGPYVARNLALGVVSGEFVTCHDADDWSHPRKLELQARHLVENPLILANQAIQARASDDIVFNRRGNFGFYCFPNLSSLMFRRAPVLEKLGCWDSVRFMADGEFLRRIEAEFGSSSTAILDRALTSFQRRSDASLTESSAFGYHGFIMGARKEYFDASFQYQELGGSLRYHFPVGRRPFAIPAPMAPKRPQSSGAPRHYDVIIASDFRLAGGSTLSSIEEIKAQSEAGLRTGIVQMARFDIDPSRRRINRKLRELINEGRADVLVYGENVTCDLLIVRYPPVLQEIQRYMPSITARNIRVIVNQPPMSDYGSEAVLRYEIPRCAENLRRYFGASGIWHPIGPAVRDALHGHHSQDLHAIDLSEEDWVNIVDVNQWKRERRPDQNGRPRIGRHARDHEVKWPGNPETLLSVYPDSDRYEIYVMGGATVPVRMLGSLPGNWNVIEFDGMGPREYLKGLDVFIYYTHHDWVESFGRVIIEAMAAGVPVVLPHSYECLFEDAALYAEPVHVLSVVDRLMADPDYYRSRVEYALDFVDRRFGYAMHIERISRLICREIPGEAALAG